MGEWKYYLARGVFCQWGIYAGEINSWGCGILFLSLFEARVDEQAQHSVSAPENQDYVADVVPLDKRRGPVTLGLLWVTMVTGFPSVLAGFDWYREGFTLGQSITCCLISCAILLAYTIPACQLGARSGQTYSLLSRSLFGQLGSRLVSFNVAWISVGWYALTAYLLADALKGLYPIPIDTALFSALLAVAMAFNNLFGFSGVANFAGYLAAPVLILWVLAAFVKASFACPTSAVFAPAHVPWPHALTLVSAFVIGYGAWGNEADFWRFSRPKLVFTILPLLGSIFVGQIIFPLTGWIMAHNTGITDYAAASALMTRYTFGGMSGIAALVLVVTYCALNDANLYAAINGVENLREFPRKRLVLLITALSALIAALMSRSADSFQAVASLSSTVLPCATVIMLAEWYLLTFLTGKKPDFSRVVPFEELPQARWSAIIALFAGSLVGLCTAGIVPGLQQYQIGVCSLQAWLTSLVVYLAIRVWSLRFSSAKDAEEGQVLSELPAEVEINQ